MTYHDKLAAPLGGGGRPRRDSRFSGGWVNPLTGQGSLLDRHTRTSWCPPTELDRFTVDGLLQYSGILRRLASREPYDCTREGFELNLADPRLSAEILKASQRVATIDNDSSKSGVLQILARGRQWARAYGGALVVALADDGRDPRQPLDLGSLRTLRGFRVLDRWEASVVRWDEDIRSSRLGRPLFWQVTIGGRHSLFVHHSRVIQLQGTDLPERVLVQRQGWGGSIFDLVWIAWRNWSSTLEYLPELMTVLTQGVFKQKGLADMILANGPQAVVNRYETLRAAMGTLGELAIDAEMEDYEIQTRGVAGVSDLLDPLVDAFMSETDTPRVILKNETVGGLNSGEHSGEIRSWYDYCAAVQVDYFEPPLVQLLRWICAAQDGPTGGIIPPELQNYTPRRGTIAKDDDSVIIWRPLWQPSRAEDDEHELKGAQRRQVDVMAGVVSAAEARRDPSVAEIYGPLDADPPPPTATPLDVAANGPEGEPAEASSLPEPGDAVSPQDAAKRYAVHTRTIMDLVRRGPENGGIPHWGLGRHIRVALSDVAALARAHESAAE